MAGPECVTLGPRRELCVEVNDDKVSSSVFLRYKGQTEKIKDFKNPSESDMKCTPEKAVKIAPKRCLEHFGCYEIVFGTKYQDDGGCHAIETDSFEVSADEINSADAKLQKKIADRQDLLRSFASRYDAYIQKANESLSQLISCRTGPDCINSSARAFCTSKFVIPAEDAMGNEYKAPIDEATQKRVDECVNTISLAEGCELKEALRSTKSYRKDDQGLQTYLRAACSGDQGKK